MFNWVKRLCTYETSGDGCYDHVEIESDISEPILAIVKALEERPKTFAILKGDGDTKIISIKDRVTGLVGHYIRAPLSTYVRLPFYITKEEEDYLFFAAKKLIHKKQEVRRNRWKRKYGV